MEIKFLPAVELDYLIRSKSPEHSPEIASWLEILRISQKV